MTADHDLDNVHQIKRPEAAEKLGDLAETYGDAFSEGWGSVAPRRIAEIAGTR